MKNIQQQTVAACKALKLLIEYTPEKDKVHDILDGIILLNSRPAGNAVFLSSVEPLGISVPDIPWREVLKHYPEAQSAFVSFFDTEKETSITQGIPTRQPLQEQCDWARRNGAINITLVIKNLDGVFIHKQFPSGELSAAKNKHE